ncbi:mitochondrial intermediate peptidase [Aspergillus saccharolyticus JOP 1030-1]|uniref:Mitochondrial intermediate peptidase n=1 Tax=Aspergillus saccharolyticus JOP 1030-1 TaxID=1450539 RepID=A0A318ZCB2_9EURO|nr:metalloendopeptidase family intermediate peptidase [Aspergillus saccharolyticus JOP 1030-1]PYH44167.1 metalloendopeptidase family intermediate peptidase [Aspergillus saccharolyticus JOP 1030-1]
MGSPHMLMPLRRRPWTCRTCLSQARRSLETAAAPRPAIDYPSSKNQHQKKTEDETLRRMFDSQPFWREFSQSSAAQLKPTGLVQNQYLTSPDGFRVFATSTLQKCQAIVAKVLAASTLEEYRTMARDLDRLSDLLCRVIDLSDFIRVIHPDPRVQEAATQAYALMFEYMNVLNTTTGLNDQLKKAAANPEVTAHWSDEEKIVAQILIKDFSNSAIHMPPNERQRFVNLSTEVSQLGSTFVNGAEPAKAHVVVNANSLRGLDPMLVQKIKRWNRTASVPTMGLIPRLALRSVHSEEVRRDIYLATRTSSSRQIQVLEQLLTKRAELAQVSGFESFAHMTLHDKMAKSPEAVTKFLTALVGSNRVLVKEELAELQRMKGAAPLQPWDHAYYVHGRVQEYSMARRSRELSAVPEFFSLGTVMQGLSRLFERLYGVRLVPRETAPGETWMSDVRRLDVVDESGRHLAVIYCDLFSRPNKHPNPAHFTLRCAREISAEEVAECAAVLDSSAHPNDGMATAIDSESQTLRQLPTIALVCDFPEPPATGAGRPALLTEHSVRTLFHEMGHALHSILGQTRLQSISGTRCATDFAELPSVLMEHFALAPEVLALYARHWETDAPLSASMMQRMETDRIAHGSVYGAVENEAQILMALVDQAYHTLPADRPLDSTALYHQVATQHSSLPDPTDTRPPTSWQGFFGHLYGYGATYYSYIFDRAIANKIWEDVFRGGQAAVDREAGERYKQEVLRWGGGRNGWECVAGVLGSQNAANADGRLVEGGDEAMREVGRWGLGRDGVSG